MIPFRGRERRDAILANGGAPHVQDICSVSRVENVETEMAVARREHWAKALDVPFCMFISEADTSLEISKFQLSERRRRAAGEAGIKLPERRSCTKVLETYSRPES